MGRVMVISKLIRRLPALMGRATSKTDENTCRTCDLGANFCITKPVTFDSMIEIIKNPGKYWLEIVALPPDRN